MDETTREPGGVEAGEDAVPNVTQTPLLELASQEDGVLDQAIRRLVEDVTGGQEITAAFSNIP
jgi:FXSXX-COOH protein